MVDGGVGFLPGVTAEAERLAHGMVGLLRTAHYEAALALAEFPGLAVAVYIQGEHGIDHFAGLVVAALHKGNLIGGEVESFDEQVALQLGHSRHLCLVKPVVQLHEVHFVAVAAQIHTQIDDATEKTASG